MKLTSSQSNCLVFLEFVDEAQQFIKIYSAQLQQNSSQFKIISFHPKVKAFLEQHEIASTDSYHYCPKGSHQKLLIELERITNEIRTFFNLKDKRGVAYSYRENFIFTLRCFLSTWLYRTEVILNAIEQYRPVEVVCSGPLSLNAVRSIWTENEERFLADIICQLSEVHKFKVQILPMLDSKNVWKKSIFISIKSITRNAIGEIAKRLISFSSGSVLVPVNSHQIDLVFEDLYKETKGEKCFAFIGFPQKNKLKEFFRSVRNKRDHSYRYLFYDFDKKVPLDASFSQQCRHLEDQLLKFFQTWHYRKVSVFNWFKVKFDKAIKPEVIFKTYSHSENMLKYFSRWNPCFVMSQHARGIGAVIGELCRLKRIDSLMIPHGSFAAITDDISKKEWKENALGIVNTPYHFLALQTPLIEDFLKEIPVESKPVITGPLIFARKIATHRQGNDFRRRFAKDEEKIILHAGTPKPRQGQRFLHYETMDEYIDGMVSLIEATERMEGVKVLIRYRVIDGLSVDELKAILPKSTNYAIVSAGRFSDFLSIADLLFSFSSSTMEEALHNNIPVLLFNKFNRYIHLKGEELISTKENFKLSAVYNVNTQQELKFALQWILQNHLESKENLETLFSKYKYQSDQINSIVQLLRFQDEPIITQKVS